MLHKFTKEFALAKEEMSRQAHPEYADIVIKCKFNGSDFTGGGWKVHKVSGAKEYFDVSTPLINELSALQEALIKEGHDPLKTLLLTLHPDGKFAVDASYQDSKPPHEQPKRGTIEDGAGSQTPRDYSRDDLLAIVARAIAESLPEGWSKARMDVQIMGNHIKASFHYYESVDGEPIRFQTRQQYTPLNGMKSVQECMHKDRVNWAKAVFAVHPDGNCVAVFKDMNGGALQTVKLAVEI